VAPYRVVTLGDSIPWGQGLLEAEKYDFLVAKALGPSHPEGITLEPRRAHSGAVIGAFGANGGIPVTGEVPGSLPTIIEQCDGFSDSAETVDLVLLDGGINDVGVSTILNPLAIIPSLSARTTRACHDGMLALLKTVSAKFTKPTCKVIVTGYYTIISELSDPLGVRKLLSLYGIAPPEFVETEEHFFDPIVDRCKTFFDHSTVELQRAIVDARDPRITFVPTGFTDENAVFVSGTSLLWGLDIDDDLKPEDPVADERHPLCDLAHPGPLGILVREQCYRASAGHPNIAGARQFANQVLGAL
jgi:hypothetical protein